MKVKILLENLWPNGGVRQAIKLAGDYKGRRVVIALVPRKINSVKSFVGLLRDLVFSLVYKPKGIGLVLLWKPAEATSEQIIISTSRATLKYVSDLTSANHIHYFQHFEIWEFLNSPFFLKFCEEVRYPEANDFPFLTAGRLTEAELEYVDAIQKVNNFFTVSNFLNSIILQLNPAAQTAIKPVVPHIVATDKRPGRYDSDLLFFLRRIPFKGDDIVLRLIQHYESKNINIDVVISGKLRGVIKKGRVTYFKNPTDDRLAYLYSRAKVVVNASLCEGFGSIPQEAIAFGCSVVSSKTGWIIDAAEDARLKIASKHAEEIFINKIDDLIGIRST